MGTVIYVHGTATRQTDAGEHDYARLRDRIQQHDPTLTLDRALWGNLVGARWPAVLRSIPDFENQQPAPGVLGGAPNEAQDTPEAAEADVVALWQALYDDPFAELRLLALHRGATVQDAAFQTGESEALATAAHRVADGVGEPLESLLRQGEIAATFPAAANRVAALFNGADAELQPALLTIPDTAEQQYREALARAIVALALRAAATDDGAPPPYYDAALRDRIVEALVRELEGSSGVLGGLGEALLKPFAWAATAGLRGQRFGLMNGVVKFLGDVLAYQERGADMRALVLEKIKAAAPPVTLLAHSLGGIICVDLLLQQEPRAVLDTVQLLVTFGSQSPLLYEINALKGAENIGNGGALPGYFPPWLNIYDRNDLLSFQAASVLEGPRLADRSVSTGQPFPFSHGAYLERDRFWELAFAAIKRPQDVTIQGLDT